MSQMTDSPDIEIENLRNKIAQLTSSFQNKLLETEQDSYNKLEEMKSQHKDTLEKEVQLQKKLLIDSYELKIQHTSNFYERKIQKLEKKYDKNSNIVVAAHEKELNDLKIQLNANISEVKLHEQMKYNELLKLYHKQVELIESLEKSSQTHSQGCSINNKFSDTTPPRLNRKADNTNFKEKYTELVSKYNHIVSLCNDIKKENNITKIRLQAAQIEISKLKEINEQELHISTLSQPNIFLHSQSQSQSNILSPNTNNAFDYRKFNDCNNNNGIGSSLPSTPQSSRNGKTATSSSVDYASGSRFLRR